MANALFIGTLLLIGSAYLGYPAFVFVLGSFVGRPVKKDGITPTVSVIIAAFNEERDIARKLENTLALDYPKDRLEIIVASDCSSDATNDIVRSYSDRGVRLVVQPIRQGKTAAQNEAARVATGEILLFSDATTGYERDTVHKIVRNFADPAVGCVTGNVVYVDPAAGGVASSAVGPSGVGPSSVNPSSVSPSCVSDGMRSYWGYEFFIKQCESLCGSLIGVCGCLYAVRRSSYRALAPDMCSDFVIASEIQLQGLRTVYEPEAISTEFTNDRGDDEFRMRVRIAEQTVSSLHRYRQVLNPLRHGLFALQMTGHKVLRYSVPWLMVLLFGASLLLRNSPVGKAAVAGQIAFYLVAAGGWVLDRAGARLGLLGLPYYFVLSNAAVAGGFIKFARGQSHVVWQPLRPQVLSSQALSTQTLSAQSDSGREG